MASDQDSGEMVDISALITWQSLGLLDPVFDEKLLGAKDFITKEEFVKLTNDCLALLGDVKRNSKKARRKAVTRRPPDSPQPHKCIGIRPGSSPDDPDCWGARRGIT